MFTRVLTLSKYRLSVIDGDNCHIFDAAQIYNVTIIKHDYEFVDISLVIFTDLHLTNNQRAKLLIKQGLRLPLMKKH